MEKKESRQSTPEQEAIRAPLLELHSALLKLHKALLDSEKIVYEKNIGPIQSPNHFFQLLTKDLISPGFGRSRNSSSRSMRLWMIKSR